MGTTARCVTGLLVAMSVLAPASAGAAEEIAGTTTQKQAPRPIITGGHDQKTAWLGAEYRDLQIRKRTERATMTMVVDLQVGGDRVNFSIARNSVTVSRAGRQVVIDSPEALESVQQLLGGSAAIFAVRAMLSDLEPSSELKAPEMSLLSTAAFIASIVGDVGAPQRLADRFMQKHRGIYRQVRESGQCWSDYSSETSAAWDELQDCMDDADDKGFWRAAYERLACNAVWALRSESAWFEFLKCLSPLGSVRL